MWRVCVDGFNLSMAKGSGIATYARTLLRGLVQNGHSSQILFSAARDAHHRSLLNTIDLVDAPPSAARRRILALARRFSVGRKTTAWSVPPSPEVVMRDLETRFPKADVWWAARDIFDVSIQLHNNLGKVTQIGFGADLAPQVMHWTCPLPLVARGIPNVYTIHDLIPLRLPFTSLEIKRSFFALCEDISRRAARIFTVSETSRQDIIQMFSLDETRVVNTYQCCDIPQALIIDPPSSVARRLGAMMNLEWQGYFLFYGALEPKKNISRLVEAYLASGVASPLVIVGGRSWLSEGMLALLKPELVQRFRCVGDSMVRNDRIRQFDFLPLSVLADLIRGARATIFPSLYEGFGLPVLESMTLGTPVITSASGALKELSGEAACLVDPYDVRSMEAGIRAVDQDEDYRSALSQKGLSRAALFSPDAYADRLRAAYHGIC